MFAGIISETSLKIIWESNIHQQARKAQRAERWKRTKGYQRNAMSMTTAKSASCNSGKTDDQMNYGMRRSFFATSIWTNHECKRAKKAKRFKQRVIDRNDTISLLTGIGCKSSNCALSSWWHKVNKLTIVYAQENLSVKCMNERTNERVHEWNRTWCVCLCVHLLAITLACQVCASGRVRIIFKCNWQNGSLHLTHRNKKKMHATACTATNKHMSKLASNGFVSSSGFLCFFIHIERSSTPVTCRLYNYQLVNWSLTFLHSRAQTCAHAHTNQQNGYGFNDQ